MVFAKSSAMVKNLARGARKVNRAENLLASRGSLFVVSCDCRKGGIPGMAHPR